MIVDDDRAPRDERAHERNLVLRIKLASARVNSVRRGVLAASNVVARGHPHDVGEHLVRVKECAVGRTRDPHANRQIVGDAAYDRVSHVPACMKHHVQREGQRRTRFCYAQSVSVYDDETLFERERDAIFSRAWTCAGRSSDVEQPGAYVRARDVVVMRGEDLVLRAFYNACRHRGTPLVEDDAGRVRGGITCPYHGWAYACSGALRSLGASNVALDAIDRDVRAGLALREVRVAEWRGFVFVATDAHALALDAWMGEPPHWLVDGSLACDLALVKRAQRVVNEAAANWKLLVANFQESHHFPHVHPELER